MVSTPLGTLIGGPLVGALGASDTFAASGIATVALAIAASIVWTRDRAGDADRSEGERGSLDPQRT
jgi:predicted MFS family arabinose efflux permease